MRSLTAADLARLQALQQHVVMVDSIICGGSEEDAKAHAEWECQVADAIPELLRGYAELIALKGEDPHITFRCHLVRHGLSQRSIARQLGITVQYLNDVVRCRRRAQHVRARLIAEFGIPAELIEFRPAEVRGA